MPTITLALKHHLLDEHNASLMRRIELETSTSDEPLATVRGAMPAGHEDALRGWPVVGAAGVPGVQKGSRPGTPSGLANATATKLLGGRPTMSRSP
jgi:hypothetical protein